MVAMMSLAVSKVDFKDYLALEVPENSWTVRAERKQRWSPPSSPCEVRSSVNRGLPGSGSLSIRSRDTDRHGQLDRNLSQSSLDLGRERRAPSARFRRVQSETDLQSFRRRAKTALYPTARDHSAFMDYTDYALEDVQEYVYSPISSAASVADGSSLLEPRPRNDNGRAGFPGRLDDCCALDPDSWASDDGTISRSPPGNLEESPRTATGADMSARIQGEASVAEALAQWLSLRPQLHPEAPRGVAQEVGVSGSGRRELPPVGRFLEEGGAGDGDSPSVENLKGRLHDRSTFSERPVPEQPSSIARPSPAIDGDIASDGYDIGGIGGMKGGNAGGGQKEEGGGGLWDGGLTGTDSYYQSALQQNPSHPLLLRNYARYLLEVRKDLARAEEFCERAILANPSDGEALCQYAKLIWRTHKDKERAGMYFEQAIRAAPENCYVLAAYASFLWSSDEIAEQKGAINESCSASCQQTYPAAGSGPVENG